MPVPCGFNLETICWNGCLFVQVNCFRGECPNAFTSRLFIFKCLDLQEPAQPNSFDEFEVCTWNALNSIRIWLQNTLFTRKRKYYTSDIIRSKFIATVSFINFSGISMNFSNSVEVAVVVVFADMLFILMFSLISSWKWDINLSTSSSANIHIHTLLASDPLLSHRNAWLPSINVGQIQSNYVCAWRAWCGFDDKIRPNEYDPAVRRLFFCLTFNFIILLWRVFVLSLLCAVCCASSWSKNRNRQVKTRYTHRTNWENDDDVDEVINENGIKSSWE